MAMVWAFSGNQFIQACGIAGPEFTVVVSHAFEVIDCHGKVLSF
jgi:hypothetical protein